MVALLRGRRAASGRCSTRSPPAATSSPPRNFLKIDEAISAYLHGNRRPYRRLTEADPGAYGIYRAYSRGDELAVSCNDYPMLWDKRAGAGGAPPPAPRRGPQLPQGALRAVHAARGRARVHRRLHGVPGVAEAEPALPAAGPAEARRAPRCRRL